MTTIVRLEPPIPLTCKHPFTGEDDSMEAWFYVDRGTERYSYFVGALDSDGSIWELDNTEVRACKNITVGRTLAKEKAPVQKPVVESHVFYDGHHIYGAPCPHPAGTCECQNWGKR